MKSSDDLQQLHSAANESFERRLHDALLNLCSGAGCIGTPFQTYAGSSFISPDAPKQADARSDIESDQGPIA